MRYKTKTFYKQNKRLHKNLCLTVLKVLSNTWILYRIIHQGMLDNNLGQEPLIGPNALDTTISDNQSFDCTNFVLNVPIAFSFSPRHSP